MRLVPCKYRALVVNNVQYHVAFIDHIAAAIGLYVGNIYDFVNILLAEVDRLARTQIVAACVRNWRFINESIITDQLLSEVES